MFSRSKGEQIMSNLIKTINLTEEEKRTLQDILRKSTIEARTFIRAKILLLKEESKSNEYIADKLDIAISTVRLCIDKYTKGGIEHA
jgi:hypothetical protein